MNRFYLHSHLSLRGFFKVIIGTEQEQKLLEQIYSSKQAEWHHQREKLCKWLGSDYDSLTKKK